MKKNKRNWFHLIIKILLLITNPIFISCADYSSTSFKNKYNYVECVAICARRPPGLTFSYEYDFFLNNKRYTTIDHLNMGIDFGYKYKILVDSLNPEKNNLILFEYPIIDIPLLYQVEGQIISVVKNNGFLIVKYSFSWEQYPGEFTKIKTYDFLPKEYYDQLKNIKKNHLKIKINLYDNKEYIKPHIDRESLKH
jgi:hypothetical protein